MLTKRELNLLAKVTQIDAIPGVENRLAAFIKKELERYGFTLVKDNLGSIFGLKKSTLDGAPRVMVASHMDEVGFMTLDIKDNGIIKAEARGGITPNTLLSQRVRMTLQDGRQLDGSIGALAPHLGGTSLDQAKISDLDFDFGFKSKEQALQAGVSVGNMIVVDGPFKVLHGGQRLLSKAFDNRYGVFMMLEMARRFRDVNLPYDLYLGATVKEEVGLRGAETIADVINPDFAIVLDCSPARDTISKDEEGQLGGGVLIRYLDRSMIAFPELLTFQEKMCAKEKVPYQYYSSMGGTDAGAFHLHAEGVLTLTHCICARSLHTAATVVDTSDIKNANKVLIRILKTLNAHEINKFRMHRR